MFKQRVSVALALGLVGTNPGWVTNRSAAQIEFQLPVQLVSDLANTGGPMSTYVAQYVGTDTRSPPFNARKKQVPYLRPSPEGAFVL